jgi:hypothetical protein
MFVHFQNSHLHKRLPQQRIQSGEGSQVRGPSLTFLIRHNSLGVDKFIQQGIRIGLCSSRGLLLSTACQKDSLLVRDHLRPKS